MVRLVLYCTCGTNDLPACKKGGSLRLSSTAKESLYGSIMNDCLNGRHSTPEKTSFNHLVAREASSAQRMGREPRPLTPKFVALHTLAHLAIRRLVFACGYGSASLRERLYISDNPKSRMAGILIYTASGDSEGSLGGLVSMGA